MIFVEPQGVEKTTQTLLLKLWLKKAHVVNVDVEKFIYYTITVQDFVAY